MNLRDLMEKRAEELGNKVAVYWKEEEISYYELNQRCNQVANMFYNLGLRKGDVVSVLLPNRPEYIYLYFGLPKIGIINGPINSHFKSSEIQYVVNHAEAKYLVTQPSFMETITPILKDLPHLKGIILLDEDIPNTIFYDKLLAEASSKNPPDIIINEREDPAQIIYTSGTTGFPKGVLQTHHNILINAKMIQDHFGDLSEDFRYMTVLPLFHVNAQIVTTVMPIYAKKSSILTTGFSAKNHWNWVARYKTSCFSAVPTILAILLRTPHENLDLSSLEWIICGAAPLPVELQQAFETEFKCNIIEGYGLTEGTCASSANPLPTASEDKRKIGSIGIPLPYTEMKIVNNQGKEGAVNEIGEILIKGENNMKGYYKDPEVTAVTLDNGWLHTGDLGYKDEDGFFYIQGRLKEMIIRGGENIYPREIEEILYKLDGVTEAAVVGVQDEIYGELPKAFLVLNDGFTYTSREIIDFCSQHLADFKVPKYVEFRQSLPKNQTGKILKKALKEN